MLFLYLFTFTSASAVNTFTKTILQIEIFDTLDFLMIMAMGKGIIRLHFE